MNIIITGRGLKITKAIRSGIKDMLSKHNNFLKKATKIEVEVKQTDSHEGVKDDITLEITITMPKVLIRVEERGSDLYILIDKVDPVLRRRLVRYSEYKRKLEGKESWKILAKKKFEEEIEKLDEDVYAQKAEVEPLITRYKQYSQNSPMHPMEAIERMELLGHEAFLFKNIETNKYSMVYKRKDNTYGLVEPKEQ